MAKFSEKHSRSEKGFSLIELMTVVAIIGILVAMAVPKFQAFQGKARQAEAKSNLNLIFTLEQAFYTDNNSTFAAMAATGQGSNCAQPNDLGFVLAKCDSLYNYVVTTGTGASGATFTATATGTKGTANLIFPGCSTDDKWTIDHDSALTDVNKASTKC